MSTLIAVEIRRLFARRVTKGLLVATMAMMAVGGFLLFLNTAALTDNEEAFAQAERDRISCEAEARNSFDDDGPAFPGETVQERIENFGCQRIRASNFTSDNRFCLVSLVESENQRNGCDRVDAIENGQRLDDRFRDDIFRGYSGVLPIVALPLLLLALVIPASFVGAEYRTGTMENLLLWEPRRWRVLGAKFIVGAACAAAIQIFLMAFMVVVVAPAGILHGSTVGTDTGFWLLAANITLRSAIAAALVAVASMSLAVISRHSAGALAGMIGYGVIALIVFGVVTQGGLIHREAVVNLQAFVRISELERTVRVDDGRFGFTEQVFSHGSLVAGVHVLVWTAIPACVAFWLFRRRDID